MSSYKRIEIAAAFQSFDDILDVRSPAEYFDDHMPGAINVPVLNDEERVRIGTLYKQVSPFDAKKLGAALIANNISQHLQNSFCDKPKSWRPLVYCWRGGMRSGAMAHILAQIGWHTSQLIGGYKDYRRYVISAIDSQLANFKFCVISGSTGSGKSHLLHALAAHGAQVLDLEALAQHRGSLLGRLPNQQQPSQKTFETRLWHTMQTFTPNKLIYIESESRKVGVLSLPTCLVEQMRASIYVRIEVPLSARITFLMADYPHFLASPTLLTERLTLLIETHGHAVINRWCDMAQTAQWQALVSELLVQHYDPAYKRSSSLALKQPNQLKVVQLDALDSASLNKLAKELIQNESMMHD